MLFPEVSGEVWGQCSAPPRLLGEPPRSQSPIACRVCCNPACQFSLQSDLCLKSKVREEEAQGVCTHTHALCTKLHLHTFEVTDQQIVTVTLYKKDIFLSQLNTRIRSKAATEWGHIVSAAFEPVHIYLGGKIIKKNKKVTVVCLFRWVDHFLLHSWGLVETNGCLPRPPRGGHRWSCWKTVLPHRRARHLERWLFSQSGDQRQPAKILNVRSLGRSFLNVPARKPSWWCWGRTGLPRILQERANQLEAGKKKKHASLFYE